MIFHARSFTARPVRVKRLDSADILEDRLESYLGLVQPNPEFVSRLKTRLTNEPTITVERRYRMAAFVVAASGLFMGAFIVWLAYWVRSLILRGSPSNAS